MGSDCIVLGEGTWMGVDICHLRFEPLDADARAVLSAIIAHPAYAHDYCSPFDPDHEPESNPVHGRWWLAAIGPERFQQITAGEAVDTLIDWGQQGGCEEDSRRLWQEWTTTLLEQVRPVLEDGLVLELQNPPAEDEHTYGWVTGGTGFHEFVVINPAGRVHLVVATDD